MSNRKLYNIYGKKQLNEKMERESFKRITCSFYNYFNISEPEELRDPLYDEFEKINILGRVYIAKEGINAQISVPENAWDSFMTLTQKYPFMKKAHIKKAIQEGLSFLKLKILIKKEIVAWGIAKEEYDMEHKGKHLNAKEFNDLIAKEDTLLIDMRNSYESEVGKFKNAICPKSKRSNELIKEVEKIKNNKTEIDNQVIKEILTVNGVRFIFEDGSWGLIRASSNKPSLVVVTESPTSDGRKKRIFDFIDDLLKKTGKVGEYDQKI